MTEPKKVRALRMHSVMGDGRPNTDLIRCVLRDPRSGEELVDETGEPCVYVMLRPIGRDEHEAIIQEHTRLERAPGGAKTLMELTDARAVDDEVMRRGIRSWHGLVGADDKALACTDQTKILLDSFVKLHISRKLFGLEATEVAADTFR